MPISKRHRVIFVHIPKTSGTYVESIFDMHGERQRVGLEPTSTTEPNEFLWGAEYQHLTIHELSRILAPAIFDTFFKFSIVRNPYDRLVSEIAWRSGYKSWQTKTPMPKEVFGNELDSVYRSHNSDAAFLRSDRHFMHQHLFVEQRQQIGVDKVFRYEEYDEINAFLRAACGKRSRQKRMVARKLDRDEYLTGENKEKIYEMYRADFEHFSYSR